MGVQPVRQHDVVVPLVVISELEAKRHHHELDGSPARRCVSVRRSAPRTRAVDQPIPVGTCTVSAARRTQYTDPAVLPAGFRAPMCSNDSRILSCAANLVAEGKRVTLVSKDIPLCAR